MFVLSQIHAWASANPRKLALVFNGYPLSYGTFWRYIEGCRRSLAPHVPDQGIVLIWVDSLLEAWILELTVRALGLDSAPIRNADQVGLFGGLDVAAVITLASEPGHHAGDLGGVKRLSLSDPSKQSVDIAAPLPPFPEIPRCGSHVGLTSGTTGRYKKVRRDFGGDPGPVKARQQRYADLGEDFVAFGPETVLNLFNMGLWSGGGHGWPINIWSMGAALVIEQRREMQRAFDWPGITHSVATPLYLAQLMALPEGAFPFLPHMQLIVNSGAVGPVLAREAMRRLTPRLLINMSSTEAGGWARSLVKSDEDLRWYRLDRGREVEIVDEAGAALPAGQMGRVRIKLRDDNATNYLGDPETSAAFFSDGWFYSGDLGELDGQGRLALYGRTSDIVSIGGVKLAVEPWERALQEALACEAVCVVSGNWRTGAEEVYVFIESHRPMSADEAEGAVRQVMSGIGDVGVRVVDSLPRTPTGKVRRIEIAQRLRDAYATGEGDPSVRVTTANADAAG